MCLSFQLAFVSAVHDSDTPRSASFIDADRGVLAGKGIASGQKLRKFPVLPARHSAGHIGSGIVVVLQNIVFRRYFDTQTTRYVQSNFE